MPTKAISIRDFSFRYKDEKQYALKHIDFDLNEGSFLCIVGSNGSGKSTLCSALVGLIPHHFLGKSHGSVKIFEQAVDQSTIADLSTQAGYVFQNPFNQISYTTDTVAEELAYGLCNRGTKRSVMKERVEKIAHLMHLEDLLERNPLELSGGQVQRVALGSTLVMEPKMLVLDECTTQLDPLGSEEIFDIVKNLNDEGITVVMVDHDMERVSRCADTILVLEQGNQIAIGSPREIFSDLGLASHGVAIPDFSSISYALHEADLSSAPVCLTEEEAVKRVEEVLEG